MRPRRYVRRRTLRGARERDRLTARRRRRVRYARSGSGRRLPRHPQGWLGIRGDRPHQRWGASRPRGRGLPPSRGVGVDARRAGHARTGRAAEGRVPHSTRARSLRRPDEGAPRAPDRRGCRAQRSEREVAPRVGRRVSHAQTPRHERGDRRISGDRRIRRGCRGHRGQGGREAGTAIRQSPDAPGGVGVHRGARPRGARDALSR